MQKVKYTPLYNTRIFVLYIVIHTRILLEYTCVFVSIGTLYTLCYTVQYSKIILYCIRVYNLCITVYTLEYTAVIHVLYSTVFSSFTVLCTYVYHVYNLVYSCVYYSNTVLYTLRIRYSSYFIHSIDFGNKLNR